MKVLAFCGGQSAERLVSLASGDAVAKWIAESGHDVLKFDPAVPGIVHRVDSVLAPAQIGALPPASSSVSVFDPKTVRGILDIIERETPDFIFPILHGGWGEDGKLQALLDWVQVPYACSGALASALAMNKQMAKTIFAASGVSVAKGFVVPEQFVSDVNWCKTQIEDVCGFPAVIKPCNSGSAVGVSIVNNSGEIADGLKAVREQHDVALVESFFRGRELTVTIVNGEPYPVIEISPHDGFYDYHNKYTAGRTDYLCPAPITDAEKKSIQRDAVTAFNSLGCSGIARVDFLLNDHGRHICLEVNTLPGMTATSLVPKSAIANGIAPAELMTLAITSALQNKH